MLIETWANLASSVLILSQFPFLLFVQNQKLNLMNQYFWPTLTYSLQCTPLDQIPTCCLKDVEILFRSAGKEGLFGTREFRGLGIMNAEWEVGISANVGQMRDTLCERDCCCIEDTSQCCKSKCHPSRNAISPTAVIHYLTPCVRSQEWTSEFRRVRTLK